MSILSSIKNFFKGEITPIKKLTPEDLLNQLNEIASERNIQNVEIIRHRLGGNFYRCSFDFKGKKSLVVIQYAGMLSQKNGDGSVGLIPYAASDKLPLFTEGKVDYDTLVRVFNTV